MNRPNASIVLLVALALTACGGSSSSPPSTIDPGEMAPDFALEDANPNSPTATEDVSPRDYVGKVSAYYFGHAT